MVAKKNSRSAKQTTLRYVWLASLGTMAVARREVRMAAEIAVDESGKLRERALRLAGDAKAIARGGLMTVREQVEPILGELSAEVDARLAPLLDKLGIRKQVRKPIRKARRPAVKKSRRVAKDKAAASVRKGR